MSALNPTALLKIMGALAPLMGDPANGAAMVAEIKSMFDAMRRAAEAQERIDRRLSGIEEKLQDFGLRLSDKEVAALIEYQPAVLNGIEPVLNGIEHD